MHILTKSLIGISAAGATATGVYFGVNALTEESDVIWGNNNKAWFDKWNKFKSEKIDISSSDLGNKWLKLSQSFKSKTSLSTYGLAREFQKWCATNEANNSDYSEIKSGICSN